MGNDRLNFSSSPIVLFMLFYQGTLVFSITDEQATDTV